MEASQAFFILSACGLALVLIEVFMPGAILGIVGGLLLFAAGITAFVAYGPMGGLWASLGLMVCSVLILLLWFRILPSSMIGKAITLEEKNDGKVGAADQSALIGARGKALCALRPAGIAQIAGARRDVWAESSWVDEGQLVQVVKIDANRIVVREVQG